jgi:hypothetical protein
MSRCSRSAPLTELSPRPLHRVASHRLQAIERPVGYAQLPHVVAAAWKHAPSTPAARITTTTSPASLRGDRPAQLLHQRRFPRCRLCPGRGTCTPHRRTAPAGRRLQRASDAHTVAASDPRSRWPRISPSGRERCVLHRHGRMMTAPWSLATRPEIHGREGGNGPTGPLGATVGRHGSRVVAMP